ncbi:MAG: L,D-transpeptidase family protein [Tepidisphaerales bacterium]
MRRRRRSSRWLATILAVATVSGASFTVYRLRASGAGSGAGPSPLAAVDVASPVGDPPPVKVVDNPVRQPLYTGKVLLVMTQTPGESAAPAVQPAAAQLPATRPAQTGQSHRVPPVSSPAESEGVHPASNTAGEGTGGSSSTIARSAQTVVTPTTRPAEPVAVRPTTLPGNLTGNPLVDARGLVDANQPLVARVLLNEALHAGKLSEADTAAAKTLMASLNQDLIFGRKFFADDPFQATYTVQFGDRLQKVAQNHDITWEFLCRLNGIADPKKVRAAQTVKIVKGPFHALVTKSKFTMDLYLGSPGEAGSLYLTSYAVGLGKDDSTPPGTWMVDPQRKLKKPTYYSPRGEGVIPAGDPRNPLGDYWIGLTGVDGQAVGKLSYGIHGTIDPDSIGKMESMGCIRMRNEDVALVFELLLEGKSTVIVKE